MKPMLFNTEMVRAILDGRKTVTRRVVKTSKYIPENAEWGYSGFTPEGHISVRGRCWINGEERYGESFIKRPYQVGDILYVRETFFEYRGKYYYKADGKHLGLNALIGNKEFFKWHPSIHMPKKAARLFLRVTGVRVERLQDMNLDDFCSEGVGIRPEAFNDPENSYWQGREVYIDIWNPIYASPQPVKENGKIVRYESYPWEDIREPRTYQGLPWLVIGNPWIWVVEFERISKK